MDQSDKIIQIPIEEIIPNKFQPRQIFDDESLTELSNSIKQHGIIQPIIVRKNGEKYEIIAGERRYRAAKMAGLISVPSIVSKTDDLKSSEVALVENVQRKNLSAIEEAKSYKNILEQENITQEELANKMGISQSAIANKIRLLNLCEEVQDALLNQEISERHARSLLTVSSKEEQKKLLQRIKQERLTVRQLDMIIQNDKPKEEIIDDVPIVDINKDINLETSTNEVSIFDNPSAIDMQMKTEIPVIEEIETLDDEVIFENDLSNTNNKMDYKQQISEIKNKINQINSNNINITENDSPTEYKIIITINKDTN